MSTENTPARLIHLLRNTRLVVMLFQEMNLMENQEDLKGASPGHRLDRPRHRVENGVPLSRQLRRITSSIKSTFARTGGLAGEQNVGGGMGACSKSGWIGYLTLIDPIS